MVIRYLILLLLVYCQIATTNSYASNNNVQRLSLAKLQAIEPRTSNQTKYLAPYIEKADSSANSAIQLTSDIKQPAIADRNRLNATFSIASAVAIPETDNDNDGFFSTFLFQIDADVSEGTETVYWEMYYKTDSTDWQLLTNANPFSITGATSSDALLYRVTINVGPTTDNYDLEVRLFRDGETDVKATRGASEEESLNDVPLETVELDAGSYEFTIDNVTSSLQQDIDNDGYHRQIDISFDANVNADSHNVFAVLFVRPEGSEDWTFVHIVDDFDITGNSPDDAVTINFSAAGVLPTNKYDLAIQLYKGGVVLTNVNHDNFSGLAKQPLEDINRDSLNSDFSIDNVTLELVDDLDSDGKFSKVKFNFNASISSGEQTVYVNVYAINDNNTLKWYASYSPFTVTSGSTSQQTIEFIAVTDFDGGNYNFHLSLVRTDEFDQLALAKPEQHSALANVSMERQDLDVATETPKIAVTPTSLKFEQTSTQLIKNSRQLSRTIRFNSGRITPKSMKANQLKQQFQHLSGQHVLMQFNHSLTSTNRLQLAKHGVKVLQYMPDNTYWVYIKPTATFENIKAAGGIHWLGAVDKKHKISPVLTHNQVPKYLQRTDKLVDIAVTLFKDVSQRQGAMALAKFNHNKSIQWSTTHIANIRIGYSQLESLAEADIVQWIEPAYPDKTTHNADLARIINVDPIRLSPLNLTGNNVDVGIWDGGAVDGHSDFDNRLNIMESVGVSSHATHVAGTIAGSGGNDSSAKGMASAVNLYSYDFSTVENEISQIVDTIELSNHSYGFITGWYCSNANYPCDDNTWEDYGDFGFGYYASIAAAWDYIVKNNQLLMFKSAGNNRGLGPDCPTGPRCNSDYDSIGYQGNSKNIMTVCATTDSNQMTSFSSWGPSNDGRVKPDLCVNGTSVYSTDTNNRYSYKQGTSMATPGATGASALLFEHFVNTQGATPLAAQLKAIILHTTTDLENTGPDYQTGWGLMNAEQAANVITNKQFISDTIEQTDVKDEYQITVTNQSSLKVTVVWTDPAGSSNAELALVNDLDLMLISPNGTEHLPWVLDPANPSAPATTGVNNRDNIEQVVVNAPVAGQWTVRVNGTNIADGPQNYTVVSQGLAASADSGQSFTITNNGTGTLEVSNIAAQTDAPWLSFSPTSATLGANESTQVTVNVDYDKAPSPNSTTRLLITSNDQTNSPFADGVDIEVVRAIDENTDSDGDGIPDLVEIANNLNPNDASDALLDADNDGLSNLAEYQAGTQINNADSDGDGMSDGFEVQYQLNPLDSSDAALDSDNDGLTNLQEFTFGTNPTDASDANADFDGDGFGNLEELTRGSDPLDRYSVPTSIEGWLDILLDEQPTNKSQDPKQQIPEITPGEANTPQPEVKLEPMKQMTPPVLNHK